jgi:hypothetical protein
MKSGVWDATALFPYGGVRLRGEIRQARAGAARRVRRRSSYRAHVQGAADPLVAGHELYDRIGGTLAERQKGYRTLFRTALEDGFLDDLRAATNGGWALGDARFKRWDSRGAWPAGRASAKEPTAQRQGGTRAIKSTLTPILLGAPTKKQKMLGVASLLTVKRPNPFKYRGRLIA